MSPLSSFARAFCLFLRSPGRPARRRSAVPTRSGPRPPRAGEHRRAMPLPCRRPSLLGAQSSARAGRVAAMVAVSLALALACQSTSQVVASHPVVSAAVSEGPPLPADPGLVQGRLDNGLTYLLRRHPAADGRVHFVLAAGVGSVGEGEEERGLSHFVQHMAFAGTEHFSGASLSALLERAGLKRTPDEIATTFYDSTIYRLSVPKDDTELLGRALDVLSDWASAVRFPAERVETERRVLLRELSEHRRESGRLSRQRMDLLLRGSRFAERDTFGSREVLLAATPEQLQAYYERWYRPDNLALVVVGDLDPEAARAAIAARFGAVSGPAVQKPPRFAVPVKPGTAVALLSDEKETGYAVEVSMQRPPTSFVTEGDYRQRLRSQLVTAMLGMRLRTQAQDPASPFSQAGAALQPGLLGAFDLVQIVAETREGQQYNTVHALLTEFERVERDGFLASEFERTRAAVQRRLDYNATTAASIDAAQLAMDLAQSYLTGEVPIGSEFERAIGERLLAELTLAEVNRDAAAWVAQSARHVIASGPDEETLPQRMSLIGAINETERLPVTPYVDVESAGELIEQLPKPGRIVEQQFLEPIGTHVWKLENGAVVVFKRTDFDPGQVFEQSVSVGGTSTAEDRDFATARYAQQAVNVGGVGQHDVAALTRLLANKVLVVSPWIAEHEEGIRASAATRDLETMMQLMYLFVTAPRRDDTAFEGFRKQLRESLRQRELDPALVFSDRIAAETFTPPLRRLAARPEDADALNLSVAMEFYKQRLGDVSDFTFVFVGDVAPDELRALVERYIASMPGTGRKDAFVDREVLRKPGTLHVRVVKGTQEDSQVAVTFHGEQPWSLQSEVDLQTLRALLELRLSAALQGKLSEGIAVQAWSVTQRRPTDGYAIGYQFKCKPKEVETLRKLALRVVADLKRNGASEAEIVKLRAQRIQQYDRAFLSNQFWLESLAQAYKHGDDPMQIIELASAENLVTSSRIKQAARRYLRLDQYVDALLLPEKSAPQQQ